MQNAWNSQKETALFSPPSHGACCVYERSTRDGVLLLPPPPPLLSVRLDVDMTTQVSSCWYPLDAHAERD